MKRFIVDLNEVHVQSVAVVAETLEEARQKALDGDYVIIDNAIEFSCTLDASPIHSACEATDTHIQLHGEHYWEAQE